MVAGPEVQTHKLIAALSEAVTSEGGESQKFPSAVIPRCR